uniref:Uncharacterized protein n=1 Tax=Arundo donax TaxID=35708 RepID=A0A0A9BV87_ARUDO
MGRGRRAPIEESWRLKPGMAGH